MLAYSTRQFFICFPEKKGSLEIRTHASDAACHRCHLWRTLATSKTLGALGGQKQCRHLDHDVMAMHTTYTLTDVNHHGQCSILPSKINNLS